MSFFDGDGSDDENGFSPNMLVKLRKLKTKKYNGKLGRVLKFLPDKGRYQVELEKSGKVLSIKPINITEPWSNFECPNCCQEEIITIVKTKCRHSICAVCFNEAYSSVESKCPICEKKLSEDFSRFEIKFLPIEKDMNIGQERYNMSFLYSCFAGDLERFQLMLPLVRPTLSEWSHPIFVETAQRNQVKPLELLLENGVDIDQKDKLGRTALVAASLDGLVEVVETLIKKQANINLCDESGMSALLMACDAGNLEITKLLVEHNACVNLKSQPEFGGLTPLYVACQNSHTQIVEYLVSSESEAAPDLNLLTEDGVSPLFIATQAENQEIIEILAENGADINLATIDGITPLLNAANQGQQEIVECLLDLNANVNHQEPENHETALFAACCGGHLDVIKVLVEHDADVNLLTKDGYACPEVAFQLGHLNVSEYFARISSNI